ncbi:hypothetical protein NSMM_490032 [Nitrosomonas mobilis]|uniref:Uncharacterized protein n=1 Tax=Nitrosomonas mobilis TaxID=51642 RepID=A0A1G5SG19_9PROT|nr:hypothetical protein NSMM_490032 [Nitrosomonas mobilis]
MRCSADSRWGGYRKNKPPFPWVSNVLKAGSTVKHDDNLSKNDYIPVQLAQKVKNFAAFWRFRRKTPRGRGHPPDEED